ncbi:MAG: ABC transporter substrate-binding protein [Aerococcus sp.]|nr:ABC transporter substrate-binding protein [Aerococcus sp.]
MKRRWNKIWIGGGVIVLILALLLVWEQKLSQSSATGTTTPANETFTYAIDGDPSSLNPINTSDRWGLTVTNMMYSPLIRIENDGMHKNELATSMNVSEDGKTLTVKLREGVKWSDGVPFTADDVVFTYTEKAKKENGNADNLWIGDKPITISKVDDHTVAFHLPEASAAAINNVATEIYIMPKHVYEKEPDLSVKELNAKPVGTGPYQLVEYKRGEYIRFRKNPTYYGGEPHIDEVTLRIISNQNTMKVALQKGEVDAAMVLPTDIEDLKQASLTLHPYSENRIGYIGLNTRYPGLEDKKVRQALFYALNKDNMNKAAYLDPKFYQTPYSVLPPQNSFVAEDVEHYQTNPEKAKALLKEAGVSQLQLKLAYAASDPAQSIQSTFIQQQLKAIGVDVQLIGGDGTEISTEMRNPDSTKYSMFLNGYIMGDDPDLYRFLFHSEGSANYFKHYDQTTDQLFAQGATELDTAKRHEIYDQLQKHLMDEAFIYPIVDNKKVLAVNKRITGIDDAKLISIYTLEDWSKLRIAD